MAEEDVMTEVKAVESVYDDDCLVIEAYPPHLHVHLKPRTAEVFSQQFVEATIGMRAGPKYPEEPPTISVIDSRGLDEQRQKHLLDSIRAKALELASCLMLVALCEEAVEKLTSMNHPDGDCPLCLHPLLNDKDADGSSLPFMKLMSCFHCFHCDCIIRWWNWTQAQSEQEIKSSSSSSCSRIMQQQDRSSNSRVHKIVGENMAMCPVCRKVFLAKDIEHVLHLVGIGDHLDWNGSEVEEEDILHSDAERLRRKKFEAILRLQQENNCLIEPKKEEVLLPGMFLLTTTTPTKSESTGNSYNSPGSRSHRKHRTPNSGKQARH